MRKIIEKIKAFFAKVKTFWVEKFIPVWEDIVSVLYSQEFVYIYPLCVFALAAFLLQSILFAVAAIIWLIPTIHAINGGKEV